jgi:dihydrofolate reductase
VRKIIYGMMTSVDGYIAGPHGELDWAVIDRELHEYVNNLQRSVDTHLYGRRTWEVMAGHWPTADENPSSLDFEVEFARIWKGLKKVVFSKTLTHVEGSATLVREVSAAEIKRMKEEPGKDMEIGGAHLAATFMRLDLIDEYQVFFHPVVLGGGTPMFPALPQRVELRLLETRAFGSGVLYVRYGRP